MSSSGPQWFWSASLNQYYYLTQGEDGRQYHVLQDGRQYPAADQHNNSPSYNSLSSVQAYRSPDDIQRRSYQQNARSDNGSGLQNVQEGFNSQSGVRSRIAVGPQGQRILFGTPGNAEKIDPSYRKREHPRRFFTIGKVFLTLWTEPAPREDGTTVTSVRFGEHVYTQIRRFVVVAESNSHCICVPITTYGGRGLRPGMNASEHALIYTGQIAPALQPSDEGLLPVAFRVDPSDPNEKLGPLSRINFGKLYTIEHNLKVKPFGVIRNKEDLMATLRQVNAGGLYTPHRSVSSVNESTELVNRPRDAASAIAAGDKRSVSPPEVLREGTSAGRRVDGREELVQTVAAKLAEQLQTGRISHAQYRAQVAQLNQRAHGTLGHRSENDDGGSDSNIEVAEDEIHEEGQDDEEEDDAEDEFNEEAGDDSDDEDMSISEDGKDERDNEVSTRQHHATQQRLQPILQDEDGVSQHGWRSAQLETKRGEPADNLTPTAETKSSMHDTGRPFNPERRVLPGNPHSLIPPASTTTFQSDSAYYSQSKSSTKQESQRYSSDNDDIATILSVDEQRLDIPNSARNTMNKKFVHLIREHLPMFLRSTPDKVNASTELQKCLKTFSTEFRTENSRRSLIAHQSAKFVSQQSQRLALLLIESIQSEADDRMQHHLSAYSERSTMSDWLASVSGVPGLDQAPEDLFEGVNDREEEDLTNMTGFDIDKAEAVIRTSTAFLRLLRAVQTVLGLVQAASMSHISEHLRSALHAIEPEAGSENRDKTTITVQFRVAWDPFAFLDDNFDAGLSQDLLDVLTLTTSEGAQHCGMTCAQYLETAWPSTGKATAQALSQLLLSLGSHRRDYTSACKADEALYLTARLVNGELWINATAPTSRMEDIAQQLAWVGAACRSCHDREHELQPLYLRPSISDLALSDDASATLTACFSITYVNEIDMANREESGYCWTRLFRGLCVAYGFPTPLRDEQLRGLEVSLGVLTALGVANRASIFDGRLVLKGHHALFIAVKSIDDCVLWHLVCSDDDDGVPYSAAFPIKSDEGLTMDCLSRARHFIGWAEKVEFSLATRGGRYKEIERPYPSLTPSQFEVTSGSISVSKIVGGSITFARSRRERLMLLAAGSYKKKIKWLQQKSIFIYDDESHQAWLQPADRVLLHALRSHIYEHYEDFADEEFKYATADLDFDVAGILNDQSFLDVILEEERSAPITEIKIITTTEGVTKTEETRYTINRTSIQSIILELHDAFFRMHGYVNRPEASANLKVRRPTFNSLEGWSYSGIASGIDDVPLHRLDLSQLGNGKGWANLCKATRDIVFIGGGFGNLILPAQKEATSPARHACTNLQSMPPNHDLLAAPINLLHRIYLTDRRRPGTTLQLAPGVHWHQSHLLFGNCSCSKDRTGNHIQELYDGARIGQVKSPSADILVSYKDGAVIFGMASKWEKIKSGAAKALERRKSPSDSGLGSSISTSSRDS